MQEVTRSINLNTVYPDALATLSASKLGPACPVVIEPTITQKKTCNPSKVRLICIINRVQTPIKRSVGKKREVLVDFYVKRDLFRKCGNLKYLSRDLNKYT